MLVIRNVCFEVVRVGPFVCCNAVCKSSLSSTQKLTSNETLFLDTTGFNFGFFSASSFGFCPAIYSTNVKIKWAWKDLLKVYCSRAENFTHLFTINKLFERIQIIHI